MKPINILWTSGWDSTFQLLNLLLVEKKQVQPYYIMFSQRKSLRRELQAIEEIKIKLFDLYPESEKLLLPTI